MIQLHDGGEQVMDKSLPAPYSIFSADQGSSDGQFNWGAQHQDDDAIGMKRLLDQRDYGSLLT
jgi:hypothetical protein